MTEMMALPKNWRFRTNWRGKIILQRLKRWWHPYYEWEYCWVDANLKDLKVFFEEQEP